MPILPILNHALHRLPTPGSALLGQVGGGPAMSKVLVWCGVLLAAAVVLGVVAMWLRRRLLREDESEGISMGFTLKDLRRMHEEGQLTDEEFDFARRKMVAKTRAELLPQDEAEDDEAAPLVLDSDAEGPTTFGVDDGSTGSPPDSADKNDGDITDTDKIDGDDEPPRSSPNSD